VEVGSERQRQMQHELDACEKENTSLNNLIVHIGEAVIRHVKNKK
jgi:hypothetical protein